MPSVCVCRAAPPHLTGLVYSAQPSPAPLALPGGASRSWWWWQTQGSHPGTLISSALHALSTAMGKWDYRRQHHSPDQSTLFRKIQSAETGGREGLNFMLHPHTLGDTRKPGAQQSWHSPASDLGWDLGSDTCFLLAGLDPVHAHPLWHTLTSAPAAALLATSPAPAPLSPHQPHVPNCT